MKVVIYVRVSTQEQAKEGYSIGEQVSRLTKYCDAMDWTIVHQYIDPGYSGGDTNRPALTKMIQDIKAGGIDKVVVYKLDRLSRSQKDTLYLIEDVFLKHNTDFVSMNENFDTSTPFGRAMIGILAVFAQLEREQIKERMGMGKEARAKEGKWGGGSSVPIGYDYNSALDLLEVNDYEAMQIHEAIELFFKGTPLRTICRIFNEKGYKYRGRSNKVHDWDPKRLKYVFTNKIYLGYIQYRKEWYKAEHIPIIDEATFKKLQKLMALRSESYAQHTRKCKAQSTYLGGMLYCKQCGARYSKNTGKKYKDLPAPEYYCCYSRSKKVPKMIKDPSCKNKNWKVPELDQIIIDEINKLIADPHRIEQIRRDKHKQDDTANKQQVLNAEIKKLEDNISRFMDLYGSGVFTIDQVNSKVAPLNEQRQKLINELNALTNDAQELTLEETLEIAVSFNDVLKRGNLDEIRMVIASLIHYIELDEDNVHIHWKFA